MARAGGITNAVNVGIAVQADWENREFISCISSQCSSPLRISLPIRGYNEEQISIIERETGHPGTSFGAS
ncbi:hypothetical protein CRYUN_Cryun15aG0103800 [Craigia yunnanensis]